jgi:hypothetical protein
MRYPTTDQSAGHRAQKGALDFGLTKRALKFARLYAENNWTITRAAQEAGFSDRGRGAHVRGCELMRDPRVIRPFFISVSWHSVARGVRQLKCFATLGRTSAKVAIGHTGIGSQSSGCARRLTSLSPAHNGWNGFTNAASCTQWRRPFDAARCRAYWQRHVVASA